MQSAGRRCYLLVSVCNSLTIVWHYCTNTTTDRSNDAQGGKGRVPDWWLHSAGLGEKAARIVPHCGASTVGATARVAAGREHLATPPARA
jgi:hypothetical protein